jgi:hypothetical protein
VFVEKSHQDGKALKKLDKKCMVVFEWQGGERDWTGQEVVADAREKGKQVWGDFCVLRFVGQVVDEDLAKIVQSLVGAVNGAYLIGMFSGPKGWKFRDVDEGDL